MSVTLLLAQMLLLGLGLVGVAAARPDLVPDHAAKGVIALVLTVVVAHIRPGVFVRSGVVLWWLGVAGLVLALAIGTGPGGVRRSVDLGFTDLVPAEFAKLAMIAYLASFFTRRGARYKLVGPVATIAVTAGLVMIAPDFEAGLFNFALALAVMFAAGVGLFRIFSILFLAGASALAFSSLYLDRFGYVLERFRNFLSINDGTADPLGAGYQLSRSLRVLERAGLWGQGPDQPLGHLPAAHTDMIVISIAHAAGLLGVSMVLLAYGLTLKLGLDAADTAASAAPPRTPGEERALAARQGGAVLAAGATIMIVGAAMINLGVAVGVLPNTGIALPLVSYGGSSMFAGAVAFGWIHGALREARRARPAPASLVPPAPSPASDPAALPAGMAT